MTWISRQHEGARRGTSGQELGRQMTWISRQLDQDLDRALDLDGYRTFVRELRDNTILQSEMMMTTDGVTLIRPDEEQQMNAEIVMFEGHGSRFELTPYPGKPGWSVVRMVSQGGLVATTAAPGAPAELSATLRTRCSSPNDVVRITIEPGMAALGQAA
jgi:hypothetical protein